MRLCSGASKVLRWSFKCDLSFLRNMWANNKDFFLNGPRARVEPECLDMLVDRTGFSKKKVRELYRAFKQQCPGGAVIPSDMKSVYAKLFPLGDSTKYAKIVFKTLDKDGNGVISFTDLLMEVARIVRGNADQKLSWIFGMYDLNGDGFITRHEMLVIVSAIYEMVTRHSETVQQTVNTHVGRLFKKMDLDKDGVISKEEFLTSCKNDQIICKQLIDFDNVWL
ncbi:neurocalcin-delta B isoform X2 [Orussus abietinus]|uniref:neurocalcin-delta B isoform X2 n=1 Tax=Orussus abietinus TaxID=222816 RepID=UPI000C7160E3|nr:neurocalcin-delta B isoform X2 [Orussus abietinus]